jgi:hypothetical protein
MVHEKAELDWRHGQVQSPTHNSRALENSSIYWAKPIDNEASSGPRPGRPLIRQLLFGAKDVVGTMAFDSLTPKPPQQDPPYETQSDCERAKVQATEAHCRSRQIVRKHCLNRHPTPSTLVHSETRVRRLRAPVERGGVAYASSRSRSSRWLAAAVRPGLPLRVPPSCKGV